MTIDRAELYVRTAKALERWTAADPMTETIHSSTPAGPEDVPGIGRAGQAAMKLVRQLEASMPFERDVDGGVWETFVVAKADGRVWLQVANAIGERDSVTTWGMNPGFGKVVEAWCRCREESVDEGTSWDEARRERRVADWGGEPSTIDRGANRIIDLVQGTGAVTEFSCEGHPGGAYLVFHGGDAETLREAFEEAGWGVEASGEKTVVRMPTPSTVADRDADWRRTCATVEAKLGLVTSASPR